jgi:hypothetical protein
MTEYRVKGAFFENPKDSGPAFTGFVEIDGVKTPMALWPKRSAAGANYLQVSEDKRQAQKQSNKAAGNSPFQPRLPKTEREEIRRLQGNDPQGELPRRDSDMDDDIPF